ncbi:Hypothetical predicted protein [Paramuricea clavata]|uniref:Uncharacterized protein n=1 Tax=Paramuricea clavata TaxID=317549 RepID=A0A6S7H767_PARCT|nr:Hypothetical predicted protein [Paramuricea clavata]
MEPSFVEQQLNISQSNKTSILGLPWDCDKDTLSVTFPKKISEEPTKRRIFGKLAKVQGHLSKRVRFETELGYTYTRITVERMVEVGRFLTQARHL